MTPPSKADLRRRLLQQRRALTSREWRSRSERLCEQLRAWPVFQDAQTLLAYFSARQEPDLSALFTLPKIWGFPVCVGADLRWYGWQPGQALKTGAYGIAEPADLTEPLAPQTVDLILVPALGGDRRGYRLGYGGGYYDRLLAQPEWAEIPAWGILFDLGYLEALPTDPWDRRLGGFCSESGVYNGAGFP
ncbi:MAG: 5-formyltetrahydrofolate cyclo-ligase [Cyanobacteriota bacterium]|jgi:5-formyltetrahydrofolate cyclo-ligase